MTSHLTEQPHLTESEKNLLTALEPKGVHLFEDLLWVTPAGTIAAMRNVVNSLRSKGFLIGTVETEGYTLDPVALSPSYSVLKGQGVQYLNGTQKLVFQAIKSLGGSATGEQINQVVWNGRSIHSVRRNVSLLKRWEFIESEKGFGSCCVYRVVEQAGDGEVAA